MKFSFFTLFPNLIKPYFSDGLLLHACKAELIEVEFINFRDFATNPYKKVDAPLIGGGAGQLITLESLSCLEEYRSAHIVFLSPCAKLFNQNDARRLAKKSHIAFVCGRYEGFDERAIESYADEVFSIGDFILMGGEIAALALSESISRQIPSVLGNPESLLGESFAQDLLEAPNFAKNSHQFEEQIKKNAKLSVPLEYSKGNHFKMASLKRLLSLAKTHYFRPDLQVQGRNDKRIINEK